MRTRAVEVLTSGVYVVSTGLGDRLIIRTKERVAVKQQDALGDNCIFIIGRRRHAGGQRGSLVPVANPVLAAFGIDCVGILEEGIVQSVAEVAVYPVVVIPSKKRVVGGVGASFEPTDGKVTAFADVGGVGIAHGPDDILGSHGLARPVEEVTGGLGHHGALPVEARLNRVVVVGMAVQAPTRALQSDLARLGSRHTDERIVRDRDRRPSCDRTGEGNQEDSHKQ